MTVLITPLWLQHDCPERARRQPSYFSSVAALLVDILRAPDLPPVEL